MRVFRRNTYTRCCEQHMLERKKEGCAYVVVSDCVALTTYSDRDGGKKRRGATARTLAPRLAGALDHSRARRSVSAHCRRPGILQYPAYALPGSSRVHRRN